MLEHIDGKPKPEQSSPNKTKDYTRSDTHNSNDQEVGGSKDVKGKDPDKTIADTSIDSMESSKVKETETIPRSQNHNEVRYLVRGLPGYIEGSSSPKKDSSSRTHEPLSVCNALKLAVVVALSRELRVEATLTSNHFATIEPSPTTSSDYYGRGIAGHEGSIHPVINRHERATPTNPEFITVTRTEAASLDASPGKIVPEREIQTVPDAPTPTPSNAVTVTETVMVIETVYPAQAFDKGYNEGYSKGYHDTNYYRNIIDAGAGTFAVIATSLTGLGAYLYGKHIGIGNRARNVEADGTELASMGPPHTPQPDSRG